MTEHMRICFCCVFRDFKFDDCFIYMICNHDFLCGVQYVARKKKLILNKEIFLFK